MPLADTGWAFYERLWLPAQAVVSSMERAGVKLDVEKCRALREEFSTRASVLEAALNNWAGQQLNWGSWQQKRVFLYGTTIAAATKKGPLITPKGFPVPPVAGTLMAVKIVGDDEEPTSEAAIRYLADHCEDPDDRAGLELLLDYSELTKLQSFTDSLPTHVGADGRIHPQLGATTETGRLACKNPNLQNIPVRSEDGARLRELFIASPGRVLLALDYSGLEWRILAHCLAHRGDMSLVEEIVAGIDPHSATAVRMGLDPGPVETVKARNKKARDDAKILNYSINYGKTGAGLGVQIRDNEGNPIGKEAGQRLLDGFFRARPGVARFHRDIVAYAEGRGYVKSLLGRPRFIPQLRSRVPGIRRKGERLAKNVIQNCATDIVTAAMVDCHAALEPGEDLILQIHDELLFEVDEDKVDRAKAKHSEKMERTLEGRKKFLCPLEVSGDSGPNWRVAGGK